MALIFPLFEYEYFGKLLPGDLGTIDLHEFPDGESLVRIDTPVQDQEVIFVCSLNQPNTKMVPLLFAAQTARELGASRIGLICPYLAYMRQDIQFHAGEGITSKYFASIISEHFDWMQTVDPHLHRWHHLSEIYSIPAQAFHATLPIANWIKNSVHDPLLIGPDAESSQWVIEIAKEVNAPYLILEKTRHGDAHVSISSPKVEGVEHMTPILVDDIISSGATLLETIKELQILKMKPPICVGVHAVFAGSAYDKLMASGARRIVTCNTIPHPSNEIDVSGLFTCKSL